MAQDTGQIVIVFLGVEPHFVDADPKAALVDKGLKGDVIPPLAVDQDFLDPLMPGIVHKIVIPLLILRELLVHSNAELQDVLPRLDPLLLPGWIRDPYWQLPSPTTTALCLPLSDSKRSNSCYGKQKEKVKNLKNADYT